MECFVFEAAGEAFGIEARYIYRITDDAKPTPVPLVPSCHVGIVYYRGDLFDVIDVGQLLKRDDLLPTDRMPYLILLKWDQRKLGLIPDRIVGMKYIQEPDSSETIITREGITIRMITPEEIWQKLSDLPYVPPE